MLGPAPIVDFDGTIACLPLAWDDLRAQVGVDRMGQLWESDSPDAWAIVRDAEIEAARHATPFEPVRGRLEDSSAFAVLTSNSEKAVALFLHRFAELESRAAVVVGRETLGGSKHDYEVFRRGFMKCVDATEAARGQGRLVYAGDSDWELDFARQLGAETIDVRELSTGS